MCLFSQYDSVHIFSTKSSFRRCLMTDTFEAAFAHAFATYDEASAIKLQASGVLSSAYVACMLAWLLVEM